MSNPYSVIERHLPNFARDKRQMGIAISLFGPVTKMDGTELPVINDPGIFSQLEIQHLNKILQISSFYSPLLGQTLACEQYPVNIGLEPSVVNSCMEKLVLYTMVSLLVEHTCSLIAPDLTKVEHEAITLYFVNQQDLCLEDVPAQVHKMFLSD